MNNMSDKELVFVPFGGVGEIGMNMAAYGYGTKYNKKWIIVDCGVSFGGPHQPGIELIMPDTAFLEEEKENVLALILTHSHEDHYGAVLDLWPSFNKPVYATPFTQAMIKAKYEGNNYFDNVKIKPLQPGIAFDLGEFNIEAINMAHSIPECNSLLIKTPIGQALHTGDWKLDYAPVSGELTDEKRLKKLAKRENGLALICDSTNAQKDGISASEEDVAKQLEIIIKKAKNRVAITSFASNIARIISIARAAKKADRKVILSGLSLHRLTTIAREVGLLDDIEPFLDQEAYLHLPRNKVVLICTGSQGEQRAAVSKIARNAHPEISLDRGDMMIFSSWAIPGNEKEVITIQNLLIDKGVEVITNNDEMVHVSGHPRIGELKQLYDWVKPDILIPVHGEAMHLEAHAKLGKDYGIEHVFSIRNGDMVRLFPKPELFENEVFTGELYLDGDIICTPTESGVRGRRRLSFGGIIGVSLCVDRNGEPLDRAQIRIMGLPILEGQEGEIDNLIHKIIEQTIYSMPKKRRLDIDRLQESLNKAIRNEIKEYWGKKPNIFTFVHRV